MLPLSYKIYNNTLLRNVDIWLFRHSSKLNMKVTIFPMIKIFTFMNKLQNKHFFYEMLTHDFSNIFPNYIWQLQYLQWRKFIPSEQIARVLISFEVTCCVHKEKTSFKCCICHTEFQQFVSIKERII